MVVHFGTNPDDERLNGKPAWALGANIYIKAHGEAEYRLLAFDTASPAGEGGKGVRANRPKTAPTPLAPPCKCAIISVFALVFQHAPLPTSPVDGGGATTPSPLAGRVGVGAMFKSHCKDTYQSRGQRL